MVEISVIMPVYNANMYLRDAIQSILEQSYKNFELIIINDGSTDNSIGTIKSFSDGRIKLINQSNLGIASALNCGLGLAEGRYIAIMNADDIALKDRLRMQHDFLCKNSDYVCVGSNAIIIDENDNNLYTSNILTEWDDIKKKLPKTPFINPSVMFIKYDDLAYKNIPVGEDSIFFIELSKKGKFYNFSEPLLKYRIHPRAISRKSRRAQKLVNIIVEKYTNYGFLEEELVNELKVELSRIKNEDKIVIYHLLLARKYLWNNPNKLLAREQIKLTKKVTLEIVVLYLLTYLPLNYVLKVYNFLKFRI